MKCERDSCADIPPPDDFSLPPVGAEAPAGRHEAEEMLLSHVRTLYYCSKFDRRY